MANYEDIDIDRLNRAIANAEAATVNANAATAGANNAADGCSTAEDELRTQITNYFNSVDTQVKRRLLELAQMAESGVLDVTVDSIQLFEDFCKTTSWTGTYEQFLWLLLESGGGSSITVDSAMSSTSTNPVQNKVIKGVVDTKQDVLDWLTLSDVRDIINEAMNTI